MKSNAFHKNTTVAYPMPLYITFTTLHYVTSLANFIYISASASIIKTFQHILNASMSFFLTIVCTNINYLLTTPPYLIK